MSATGPVSRDAQEFGIFMGLQILGLRGARTCNLWGAKVFANRAYAGFGATRECEGEARKACEVLKQFGAVCHFVTHWLLGAANKLFAGLRVARKRFVGVRATRGGLRAAKKRFFVGLRATRSACELLGSVLWACE